MGYNKQPTRAENRYQYFSCPSSQLINMQVFNASVDVGFGLMRGSQGAEFAVYPFVDEFFVPGSNTIPQWCDAIRIKNHLEGESAEYSISARLDRDLPRDTPLLVGNVPYYLRLEGGRVIAEFEGRIAARGLTLPAGRAIFNFTQENVLQWLFERTNEVANLYAFQVAARETGVRMSLKEPRSLEGYLEILHQTSGRGSINAVYEGIPRVIVNSERRSSFLQLQEIEENRAQIVGELELGRRPVGPQTVRFALPNAWSRRHTACIGTIQGSSGPLTNVVNFYNCGPEGLTEGRISFNLSAEQTIRINYMSIGT